MKPNKALQSTIIKKTGSNTKTKLKAPETGEKRVCGADNPFSLAQGVQMLYAGQRIRNAVRPLLRLEDGGFDVLIKVTYRWVIEERTSTVYGLTANDRNVRTRLRFAVNRMIDKGILQVIGSGKHGCKVFVPAGWVLEAVKEALS